jgi:tRNA (cytidine/uridine-2'-O-)-methyltransferase
MTHIDEFYRHGKGPERKKVNWSAKLRLALFEPDIPQNAGTLLRLGACLAVPVDLIGPMGFLLDDRRLRRTGLDYLSKADYRCHSSWNAYRESMVGRLILLTSKADLPYCQFRFRPDDNLVLGRESAGAPDWLHRAADSRVTIPMSNAVRSINVALAGAMVLGEALRQIDGWPQSPVQSG